MPASDVKLVAMADLFEDRLVPARERLKEANPDQMQVADDHLFSGFDAYQELLNSDIDVVILAAASHFHPVHLAGCDRRWQTRVLREAAFARRARHQAGHEDL